MHPILLLDQVSYQVADKNILTDISLSVKKGEFLTISGPSGGGKSTFLKLIASMLSPTTGSVFFKGKRLEDYDVTEYRKQVSYSFQNAALFGDTVQENMAFPYEVRGKQIDLSHVSRMLDMVSLSPSYLDKKVSALSGGEKQRIALIRNLLFLPDVLLLDEVTSALDTENRHIIGQAIHHFNKEKGTTVLWVTHNEEEIQQADSKIELVDGKVVRV